MTGSTIILSFALTKTSYEYYFIIVAVLLSLLTGGGLHFLLSNKVSTLPYYSVYEFCSIVFRLYLIEIVFFQKLYTIDIDVAIPLTIIPFFTLLVFSLPAWLHHSLYLKCAQWMILFLNVIFMVTSLLIPSNKTIVDPLQGLSFWLVIPMMIWFILDSGLWHILTVIFFLVLVAVYPSFFLSFWQTHIPAFTVLHAVLLTQVAVSYSVRLREYLAKWVPSRKQTRIFMIFHLYIICIAISTMDWACEIAGYMSFILLLLYIGIYLMPR